MQKSTWTRLLAALLAFALFAAACGSDADTSDAVAESADDIAADANDNDEPEPEPEPEDEAPAADEPEEELELEEDDTLADVEVDEEAANCATSVELDRGTYAPNGSLVSTTGFTVGSLNPHDDQTPATFAYYSWLYEGLVRQAADGSIVPWLAKCFEISEAGDEVTFFLHEGITFHDGSPFNADAVVQNIEFIKTAGPPQVIPPVAGQLGIVDSVEAIDDLTVKFALSAPGSSLLLSGLIRNSGMIVAPSALGSAAENPIGTSPYKFDNANADFSEINLVAYEDYWQPGLVGLESAQVAGIGDATARLDGYNAGQIDTAALDVRVVRDQLTRGDFVTGPNVRIGFVFADWVGETIPQLANKDVRCAMAAALNRDGIQAQAGTPEAATKQFAAGPNDYGWIDDLASPDFDIDAAKAAFEATGEEPFEFLNGHLGAAGTFAANSQAMATGLAELGITMNNEVLDPPSPAEMFVRLAASEHPMQVIPFNEPNALMSLIARTGEAAFNPSGVSPDGVVELVASARSKSFEDGEADVAAAWKIMLEECVFVVSNVLISAIAVGEDVEGIEMTQGIPVHFWPHGVTKTS